MLGEEVHAVRWELEVAELLREPRRLGNAEFQVEASLSFSVLPVPYHSSSKR